VTTSPELPPPPPPPPTPARPQFDFVKPFAFTFEDPEWVQKILLGGVFVLASMFIVGIFFIYGYLARLVRNVVEGVRYPLPAWDDLGEYFTEGARLFGVILVYILPVALVAMTAIVPVMIMEASGSEAAHDAGGLIVTCLWCLIFPVSLALALWMPAALLRVAIERRFSAGFEFAPIWDFIRGNAGNYILAIVVRMIAGFVAQFGIALLCIGIIFTGFWAMVVGAYGFAQAYRLAPKR
jgi:hypothetical protein